MSKERKTDSIREHAGTIRELADLIESPILKFLDNRIRRDMDIIVAPILFLLIMENRRTVVKHIPITLHLFCCLLHYSCSLSFLAISVTRAF